MELSICFFLFENDLKSIVSFLVIVLYLGYTTLIIEKYFEKIFLHLIMFVNLKTEVVFDLHLDESITVSDGCPRIILLLTLTRYWMWD